MSHTRYTNNDPRQGSAFMETVVYPTLAPHLARDFHLPGTAEYNQAAAERTQAPNVPAPHDPAAGVDPAGAANDAMLPDEDPPAPVDDEERLPSPTFFVQVEWTHPVLVTDTRGRTTSKLKTDTKNVDRKLPVFDLSRREFLGLSLGAWGLQNMPGIGDNGPVVEVSFPGFPGGKGRAPRIANDSDWSLMKQRITDKYNETKGKLNTVFVNMKMLDLDPFRIHGPVGGAFSVTSQLGASSVSVTNSANIALPAPGATVGDAVFGTQVPTVGAFTEAEREHGHIIAEIKASNPCAKHNGVGCYVQPDATHIPLTRIRIAGWAAAVAAGACTVTSPPLDLLASWSGGAATVKPRGRSGPRSGSPMPPPSTSTTSETTNLLIATMVPVAAMLSQSMAKTLKRQSAALDSSPPSSPTLASSDRASSPVPTLVDESGDNLRAFLGAFCSTHKLSDDVLESMFSALNGLNYTPDILGETTVVFERIQGLSGLSEGHTHSLIKFAKQWNSKGHGSRSESRKRVRISKSRTASGSRRRRGD